MTLWVICGAAGLLIAAVAYSIWRTVLLARESDREMDALIARQRAEAYRLAEEARAVRAEVAKHRDDFEATMMMARAMQQAHNQRALPLSPGRSYLADEPAVATPVLTLDEYRHRTEERSYSDVVLVGLAAATVIEVAEAFGSNTCEPPSPEPMTGGGGEFGGGGASGDF